MSEKQTPVNAQNCDPSTLGIARRPRPAVTKAPETEVVVQLGPFTDGQITEPEFVRPLEGPQQWLIKPKTGQIVPLEADAPPEKNVIRKYITVGAQDQDVPDDLPKISDGYVVNRVNEGTLPGMDGRIEGSGIEVVTYVQNRYDSGTVTCESKPDGPINESETPTPAPTHPPTDVPTEGPTEGETEPPTTQAPTSPPTEVPTEVPTEGETEPPTTEAPTEEPTEAPTLPPTEVPTETPTDKPTEKPTEAPTEYPTEAPTEGETEGPCKPCDEDLKAVDDKAWVGKGKSVTIDVLENDKGCGDIKITKAYADCGTVEIVDNKLVYTPFNGFSGKDTIYYEIDNGCATDEGKVRVDVGGNPPQSSPKDWFDSAWGADSIKGSLQDTVNDFKDSFFGGNSGSNGAKALFTQVNDYEFDSKPFTEPTGQTPTTTALPEGLSNWQANADSQAGGSNAWSETFQAHQFDGAQQAGMEEPAVAM